MLGSSSIVPEVGQELLCLPQPYLNLLGGLSIAQPAVGVKGLAQAPWFSRIGLQAPGKITTTNPFPGEVTGCNPHRRRQRAVAGHL